jgi:5'(3')-deoxyribonucleotidase
MIVYIDLDDTICNYRKRYEELKIREGITYPQSLPNFYTFMKPIDGAIDAVREIHMLHSMYILTAPSPYNLHTYSGKAQWVEKYLGFEILKNLIICPNKGLLKGDVLIDDRISGYGQEYFSGEIIKFDHWNITLNKLKNITEKRR